MRNKILVLNLIKEWFNLTLQGIKKEEYRAITPYWLNRFMCVENGDSLTKCYSKETIEFICFAFKNYKLLAYESIEQILNQHHIRFKDFKVTDFRNGYKLLDKVPRFIIENKGITIGKGKPEWGYTGEDNVFIIHHGRVLELSNIK